MNTKHEVVFFLDGATVTAQWTQEQLARNLTRPDLKLISVNAKKPLYKGRKRKK